MSEATSFPFNAVLDEQWHVYQIDFRQSVEGPFIAMRLDPGNGAGNLLHVDYWRFGSFDPTLKALLLADGKLLLSWPTAATGYALQSSTSLTGGRGAAGGTVATEGNESVVIVQPAGNGKFYRLVK